MGKSDREKQIYTLPSSHLNCSFVIMIITFFIKRKFCPGASQIDSGDSVQLFSASYIFMEA